MGRAPIGGRPGIPKAPKPAGGVDLTIAGVGGKENARLSLGVLGSAG